AAGDGLDLRRRHHQLIYVFGGTGRHFAGHDLADESRLALDRLPLIGVKRSFGDVITDVNFRKDVSLTNDPAFALLQLCRFPRNREIMPCDQSLLKIRATTCAIGGGDQHTNSTGVDFSERVQLTGRRWKIVNESDLFFRNAASDECAFDLGVEAQAFRSLFGGFRDWFGGVQRIVHREFSWKEKLEASGRRRSPTLPVLRWRY